MRIQNYSLLVASVIFLNCGANMQFLRFEDAERSGDHGILAFTPDSTRELLLLPVVTRTLYDNGVSESSVFTATHLRMIHHIDSLLRLSGNRTVDLLKTNSTDRRRKDTAPFAGNVAKNATLGAGNPLHWGAPIPDGAIGSTSLIFLPVTIQRESRHEVTGRLYMFIATSAGEILFCRSIDFAPIKWSSDLNAFEKDIKGHIPLVLTDSGSQ